MPDSAGLMEARGLMYARRHEEALAAVLGLHAAAAANGGQMGNPALSYTLGLWGELAEHHLPAHQALARLRDRDAAALLAGPPDPALFRHIASLDARLHDAAHTHALFLQVLERDPACGERCADAALPAMIEAGDFALAERFLPDPERTIRDESRSLNREIASRRSRRFTASPRIPAGIHIYAAQVRKILAVLEGRGRNADARRVKALAIDAIEATTIRQAVRTALLPGAKPWYARGRPNERSFYLKERRADRRAAKAGRKLRLAAHPTRG